MTNIVATEIPLYNMCIIDKGKYKIERIKKVEIELER